MGGDEGRGGAARAAQNRAYLRERNECGACCYQPAQLSLPDKLPLRAANPHGDPPTHTHTDDTVNHRVADAGDAVAISNSDAEGPQRARQGWFERIELLPARPPATGTLAADISGWFQQISLGDGPAGAPTTCFSLLVRKQRAGARPHVGRVHRHGRDKIAECANLNSFEFWLRRAGKSGKSRFCGRKRTMLLEMKVK